MEALLREVAHLSPKLRDKRLIRRFASTRGYDFDLTAALLREYATWRHRVGLEDDSLCRKPGVFLELRKRHTMRLLDPLDAPRVVTQHRGATLHGDEQRRGRLTFLELHSPTLWPTARDRDGCPVVYTNMEQYQRGVSAAVENTFVWILETVCREMDADGAEAEAAGSDVDQDGGSHGGKFTILLDLSTCPHVHKAAFFRIGMLLRGAVKKGFRGRLHRFYIYPAGFTERWLLRVIKPFLGKYTLPKVTMISGDDKAKLTEVFPPQILPAHLGGTSELLSVELACDEDGLTTATVRPEDAASVANATKAATEVAEAAAAATDQDEDNGHGDIKWFLKVPAFNLMVLLILTERSVHFAPHFEELRMAGGFKHLFWRRMAVPLVSNSLLSHIVGYVGLGIKYSGVWSAGVTVLTGVLRRFRAR